MVQQKILSYTIKHGHMHGQTKNTKEYYSFNTFYIVGFRNKYAIIYSTINNEFYRAIYLLSICCFYGGHLLIVNTAPKYSQFIYNLITLGKERGSFFFPYQKSMKKISISKQFFSLSKKEKKKFVLHQSFPTTFSFDKNNEGKKMGGVGQLNKKFNKSNENKISIFTSGGTITNWKQLFTSMKRGYAFEKKFHKYIYENNQNFPPYKKFKKSAVRAIEIEKRKMNNPCDSRPDCILILGSGAMGLLRDATNLQIPTIVTVDSHVEVNYCTYPIWGNTVSANFLSALIEWFFRYTDVKNGHKIFK
jgi:hypothetical protein